MVSVVIPTRDRVDHLITAVAAVLAQRDVDVEILIADDASTDGTPERITALDRRVRVLSATVPGGAASARNRGLSVVRGDWVAFCDDDDIWAPDKLASQLQAIEATAGAAWCVGGDVTVDECLAIVDAQRPPSGNVLSQILVNNVIPGGGSGVLASRELIGQCGRFDEQLGNAEDWDLWIRLAQASPLACVDRPLVAYRRWAGAKSRNIEGMRRARELIASRYDHLAKREGVAVDAYAHERYLAKQQLRDRKRLGAAATFLRLSRRDPWQLPRAFTALLAPAMMDRLGDRRVGGAIPPDWVAEAETWLSPLRKPGAGNTQTSNEVR